VYRLIPLLLAAWAIGVPAQLAPGAQNTLTAAQAQALVDQALANELRAAQDVSHPMRYQLHKTSPRLTTTKEILETKDGEVARLLAINDQPLSTADEQQEQARLDALQADPGKQRHRKLAEDADAGHALKVLRALPAAFVYQYVGPVEGPAGTVEKFTFKPNPGYNPPDLETEILPAMTGEIWIDPASQRVTRLEGHLQQDVDFGWGMLGRLNQGGWIRIEQADEGDGLWRTVRFQMVMSGRVFWKSRVFDTTEEESHFEALPAGLSYQKAIEMLKGRE
jgi:hypothetical protein